MSDIAKGPFAGYIYQFEQGLHVLTLLEHPDNYLSIEDVDDVATHMSNGTVLLTLQAKHSISQSGSTFSDSSYSLWRTFEIWLNKLEDGTFNDKTEFICATNKKVPKTSLIHILSVSSLDDSIIAIKKFKGKLIEKKKEKLEKGDNSVHLDKISSLVNAVLKREKLFATLHAKLEIKDETNLKDKICSRLFLSGNKFTDLQRDNIYEGLLGWIQSTCIYKWRNGKTVIIKKKDLDNKYQSLRDSPSIIRAIFRKKDEITIENNLIDSKKEDLFVQQLEGISLRKEAKDRIIRKAIEDYIRYEIEHTYVINEIGDFTKSDFDKFIEQCFEQWLDIFDSFTPKEIEEYSDDEMNNIAIKVYNYIMKNLEMNFQLDHSFHINNIYIKNGGFLKLSNIPKIGWHPNWKKLYVKKKI